MLDFVLGECFNSFNHCSTFEGLFHFGHRNLAPLWQNVHFQNGYVRTSWLNTVLALLRACIALPMLPTIDWKTFPSAGIETLSTSARHHIPLAMLPHLPLALRCAFA